MHYYLNPPNRFCLHGCRVAPNSVTCNMVFYSRTKKKHLSVREMKPRPCNPLYIIDTHAHIHMLSLDLLEITTKSSSDHTQVYCRNNILRYQSLTTKQMKWSHLEHSGSKVDHKRIETSTATTRMRNLFHKTTLVFIKYLSREST